MRFLIYLLSIASFVFYSLAMASNIQTPFSYEPIYIEGSPRSHFDGHTLVSIFPAGLYGNENSGFSFGATLSSGVAKVISYEVMFADNFDFVKGGKLPGLCGGKDASGGIPATGRNGFSARIMWRKDGRVVSYVYHMDQKDRYGDDFQWITTDKKPLFFKPGIWHKIEMRVKINQIGKNDGQIKGYLDGILAFEKSNFSFRLIEDIKVDRLCFNTFFGGDDATWSPKKDETLKIRHLEVKDD